MNANPVRRFVLLLCLGFALAALPACVGQVALDNLPCPCATGWVCCPDQNICVREGLSCSSLSLSITPSSPKVRFGGTIALTASEPVSWSLEEGAAAGSIEPDGTYHAPLSRGPFHAIATSLRQSDQTARVEVTVGPSRLESFAGHIGGYGFADGPGTDARFGMLSEVVGDGQDLLFVLDTDNKAVRKIDASSGNVSTLMQSTRSDGQLTHLGYDSQLGLVALFETTSSLGAAEDQLLIIDPATGATQTSEAVRHADLYSKYGNYYNSRTSAVAAQGDFVYEVGERQIFRRPLAGGAWELAAGALTPGVDDGIGTSRFAALQAMIKDGHGKFRLLDCVTHPPLWPSDPPDVCALRTYDPGNMEVTTIGPLSSNTHDLHRIAIDIDKDYYYLEQTQTVFSSAVPYRFGYWNSDSYYAVNTSLDAIWVQKSNLYIADSANGVIRQFGPLSYGGIGSFTHLTTLAGARPYSGGLDGVGSDARLTAPQLLAADSDGGLLLKGLRQVSAQGKVSFIGSLPMDAMVVDRGTFVFTNSAQNYISTFKPPADFGEWIGGYYGTGGHQDGVGSDVTFNQPSGIATDGMGIFYIADRGNGAIRRLELVTKTVSTLAIGFDSPFAVAVGNGEVFVAEKRAVRRVRIDSGEVTTLSDSSAGWKQISALAYDPAGILYVSDIDDARVRAIIVQSGQSFDLVGQSGVASVRLAPLPAAINTPSGLALLPSGELAISSAAENAILIAR